MTNLNTNYRIEFYGGPNDGEILFQHWVPSDTCDIANKFFDPQQGVNRVIVHQYTLSWTNSAQAKYIYSGMKMIE